uniref:Uncharacterized protein n=1 Tax=Tanacetum cinerariifolium TaxID=118510 RepID=A0A6L2MMU0_TANCI|nr:hypothetical protein [Tanacetum cinerariifolium]
MQFLNKEIQSPVAWSTTQSHFGFSSDLSEFGQHLVNKSQSALSKGAHVWRALKNRVITKCAYASTARSKIMAQEPIHAQNIDLYKNVRSHHIFNSIIQGAAIRKTAQEEAAKEKTTTEVEDAEENPEEIADVEQAFNNLSTMSFLNISTRSKTTQLLKETPKQLEEEKACRRGKVYNWETTTYKIWYDEDVHDLGCVEIEFSAIVFDDAFTYERGVTKGLLKIGLRWRILAK